MLVSPACRAMFGIGDVYGKLALASRLRASQPTIPKILQGSLTRNLFSLILSLSLSRMAINFNVDKVTK